MKKILCFLCALIFLTSCSSIRRMNKKELLIVTLNSLALGALSGQIAKQNSPNRESKKMNFVIFGLLGAGTTGVITTMLLNKQTIKKKHQNLVQRYNFAPICTDDCFTSEEE